VSSARAWLALARWRNAALAAAGVVAAAWWSGGRVDMRVALVAIAAIALTALANTVNDLADVEIDRVAHPSRPLPSGTISTRAATWFAGVCAVFSVILLAFVNLGLAVLTLPVIGLMYAYSAWFKRRGVPGNVLVGLLASLPFFYGAWVVGRPARGALLTMIALPLHFAREVAKDVDDATGDMASRRTLPVAQGVRTARAAAAAGVVAYTGAVVLIAPSYPLFALLLVPTIFLAALAMRRLFHAREGSAELLKAAMALAIVALVISGR
jgi:geranylgeranylglycerol-phosphate geranylgeranyltransferase